MRSLLFHGSNSAKLSANVAFAVGAKPAELVSNVFPDGERYVRFKEDVRGARVIIVNSMHPNPDSSLLELVFASRTARELGARSVELVVPYMGYLRQDKRFNSGESVSNHIVASLLDCADRIVTVDPHLHRISSLSELFGCDAVRVSAVKHIADFIKNKFSSDVVIVGPDAESFQWAESVGSLAGFPAVVLSKTRLSSFNVKINFSSLENVRGKNVVVVDDIISSGRTMLEVVNKVLPVAKSVSCVAVHGVFASGAYELLSRHARVLTTNTIENKAGVIDVSDLIAGAL